MLRLMSNQNKTPIWFLGTSTFAVPSLEALLKDDSFTVDLVITQPDRPAGRKQELTPPPVKVIAEKHGLTILQPENLNEYFQAEPATPLDSARNRLHPQPAFLVVVSFGQILSQQILDIPTVAPINVHASLLPRWRGASPIHHAILAGDTETGVTVQKMAKELDAGPVLAQTTITIDPRETVTTLHEKLAPMGADLLIRTLKSPLKPVEQDKSRIIVCHKLKRDDGKLDHTSLAAADIDRKVRGLTPWPSVTLIVDKHLLKLLETSLEPTMDSATLPCAKGTVLHLVRVQAAGGKPMTGAEWRRGKQPRQPK